jgi:hypothetical protein
VTPDVEITTADLHLRPCVQIARVSFGKQTWYAEFANMQNPAREFGFREQAQYFDE